MTPELRKQMEEMAYAHAGMQSPSAEMRPYYERAYTEGFAACSEIYEAKLKEMQVGLSVVQRAYDMDRNAIDALKEENRKLRRVLEDIKLQIEAEIRAERGLPLSEFGEGFNHAKHEVLSYIKMKSKALADSSQGKD